MANLSQLRNAVFHSLGGVAVFRAALRSRLRILMYHRFQDAQLLDRQCAYLRRHYHPIRLGQAVDALAQGTPLPPSTLVVTVDDGYRDFAEVAHPVFSKYRIPSALFVVSDFASQELWLWIDQVSYAFQQSGRSEIRVAFRQGEPFEARWRNREQALERAEALAGRLKRVPNDERLRLLEQLPALLEVRIPSQAPVGFQALRWEELRTFTARDVEIGAHTRRHPILSSVTAPDLLEDEIDGCKRILESNLQSPGRHFCYPNGLWADFNAATKTAVKKAGCDSAVVAEPGLNRAQADLYELVRVGVEPDLPQDYFERKVAGASQ